jgi:4-amino-4-deoxy-L-arabinose transferase-like glycosyltransferase
MWIWILVPLVFFSFSASKRPIYMLPALPAAAMLCGAVLDAAVRGQLRRTPRKLVLLAEGCALALLGVAGAGAPLLAARRAPEFLPASILLAACALAGSISGLLRLSRSRLVAAHGSLVAALALIWIVVIFRVYPVANGINSPRPFAETVARLVPAGAPLSTYGLYRFRSGYIYYADRLMPRLPDRPALDKFLGGDKRVYCLIREDICEKLLRPLGLPPYLLAKGGAGKRRECLISNQPEPEARPATSESHGRDPESPAPGARSGSGS